MFVSGRKTLSRNNHGSMESYLLNERKLILEEPIFHFHDCQFYLDSKLQPGLLIPSWTGAPGHKPVVHFLTRDPNQQRNLFEEDMILVGG